MTSELVPFRGTGPQTETERRRVVKGLWDKARPMQETREECLTHLFYLLETERERVRPDTQRFTLSELRAWEKEDGWEEDYQRRQSQAMLENPHLSPVQRLQVTLDASARAYEEYRTAIAVQQALDDQDTEQARRAAADRVRGAYNRWHELQKHVREDEEEFRRRQLESSRTVKASNERTVLVENLTQQYAGLGAHYDILIQRIASLEIRLRQLDAGGRDVPVAEYAELHRQHLAYVNQLQKYTEATKSETITKETQAVVLALLGVIERVVAPSNPTLWNEVVNAVRAQVETGGTTGLPQGVAA